MFEALSGHSFTGIPSRQYVAPATAALKQDILFDSGVLTGTVSGPADLMQRNGKWVFADGDGRDPDDAQIPGLAVHVTDWRNEVLDWYYGLKFQFLFQWAFSAVDKTAPVIAAMQPAGNVDDTRPAIAASFKDGGSGIDTSSVRLKLDGVDVTAKARISSAGVSFQPTTALAQGTHQVTLTVADKAKNVASANWSFLLDSIAPTISDPSPPDHIKNASPSASITARYADQGGSGIDTSKTRLWLNNTEVTANSVVSAGGIVFTPARKLADGHYTARLQVADMLGNEARAGWHFAVDSRGVAIGTLAPAQGAVLAADVIPKISASFVATGVTLNLSKSSLLLDGKEVTAKTVFTSTSASHTPTAVLPEGNHTAQLTLVDSRGNSAQALWHFTTRSAPEITALAPKDVVLNAQSVAAISAQFRDVGAGIDAAKTVLLLDGVDVTAQAQSSAGGITLTPTTPLPQGAHVATVTVWDKAGNSSASTWRFALDSGLPNVSGQTPKDILVGGTMPQIAANYQDSGDATSATGIDLAKVRLKLDGVDVTAKAQIGANRISYTPTMALAGGSHSVLLVVADKAGNVVESTWGFSVDGDRPVIGAAVTPADGAVMGADALPVVSATYSDAGGGIDPASVLLEVDGQNVATLATVTATGVTFTPAQPLAEGNHTVKLTVADKVGNASTMAWGFKTMTAPVISNPSPNDVALPGGATPTISANIADIGSGIDPAKTVLLVDGVDVGAQATVNSTTVSFVPTVALSAGNHTVSLSVADLSGNAATLQWHFTVKQTDPPAISMTFPNGRFLPGGLPVDISARFTGNGAAIDPSKVTLLLNGADVSAQAWITADSILFRTPGALVDGVHTVKLTVTDTTGTSASATWQFGAANPPTISGQFPDGGLLPAGSRPTIAAQFSDPKNGIDLSSVVLILDGTDVTANAQIDQAGIRFTPSEALGQGQHTAILAVRNKVNAPAFAVWDFGIAPPDPVYQMQISSPQDGAMSSTANIMVSATASADKSHLLGLSANGVPMVETEPQPGAPLLNIESPTNMAMTSSAELDVRGMVNDVVGGWIGTPLPAIRVTNTANGQTVAATVADRAYLARAVPLELGSNLLRVTATDHVGNARSREVQVSRIMVGSKRITMLKGNHQRGPANSELPTPLAIVAMDRNGNPLANLPVSFDVVRGTGVLNLQAGGTPPKELPSRNRIVRTDESGSAQIWLTIGKRAGEAENAVRASSKGIQEEVVFTATTVPGAPAFLLADGGTNQFGETGSGSLEPLGAVVVDALENRLPGIPVVFNIEAGEAFFEDANGNRTASFSTLSDSQGRAAARPTFGATPGPVIVRASALNPANQTVVPEAIFQINVLQQSNGPTRFSGKVQSHGGVPIPGVRVSIGRTALVSTTDEGGNFLFDGQVPPGKLDLFVDGRTANVQTAEYPSLHFEALAVRGQNNALPHPIYLPPLLMSGAKMVGGDQDVTLTMPGMEGFEMTVKAHSATFPDGSKTGMLVVSPVNQDKLPMVPPGGYAGFMAPAWTIQPTGTRFDPPIQVKVPNSLALKPGDTREIYQWDHDLATFVPMGAAMSGGPADVSAARRHAVKPARPA